MNLPIGPCGRCRAAMLLAVLLSGCGYGLPGIVGSGVAKTEDRSVESFSDVEVNGGIQVDLTVGPLASLEVIADDNLLPLVVTETTGDRLKIYVDASYTTKLGVKVKLSAPAIAAVQGDGATTINATGIRGSQFRLDLNGASGGNIAVGVDELAIKLNGASHCTAIGEATRLTVDCSGASKLDAKVLDSETVAAEANGASTVEVKATKELTAKAFGASTLRYAGAAGKIQRDADGASTIKSE